MSASTPLELRAPLVRILHALLLALAAGLFGSELALPAGVVAAAAGAFVGSLLAERLHRARWRLVAVWGLAGLVFVFGLGLTTALSDTPALAEQLSISAAMGAVEVVRWGTGGLAAALALRGTAVVYRAALAVEGSLSVLVVASVVAAHRDGMIARPLEISDWFWRQGIDPVVAFLGVGVAASLLLAAVLASGRSGRRTIAQLIAVLLLGLALAAHLHESPGEVPRRNPTGGELNKDADNPRDGLSTAGAANDGQGEKGQSDREDDALPPPPQQKGGHNRPTAVVVFQRDVAPFGDVFYFRHAAFSQFNGARLVEATTGLDPDARYPRFGASDVPGVHRRGIGRAQVATDVAVLSEHSRTFALIDATRIEPLPNPEPARFRRAYRVISAVPTATVSLDAFLGLEPGDPEWDEGAWSHYTELPSDERYHDLARRLQAGLRPVYRSDPVALAFAVKTYLEENTIYSFARRYEGADPTGQFLFSEDRRGYCVHLAHAGAYLLRAVGVPTRVSAGYAVPSENLGRGSALLIKDGDAHAWMEIYLRGVGWLPIEVTPERTDIQPTPFEEQDLQQLLGEMARKQGRFERAPPGRNPWVARLLTALRYSPALLLVLLALTFVVKAWRLARPLFAGRGAPPKLTYRGALDLLGGVGWVRRRGESREHFAKRVGDAAPGFTPLTEVVVATALGSGAPLSAARGRALSDWYRAVLAEVRASVPAWRFWLGVMNPISWWWSR